VDRRQALIAGAGVVAAVLFEVAQERGDPLEGEIFERQPGEPAALVGGDEHQQQLDRVAIAAYRSRAKASDRDQVVSKNG
jgi:hypothetical protein